MKQTPYIITLLLLIAALSHTSPLQAATEAKQIDAQQTTEFTKTVRGTVVDETGKVLIGASVIVPNASIGAFTDVNGGFTLVVPKRTRAAFVSYLGYERQEINLSKPWVRVVMQRSSNLSEKPIEIGYGEVRRKDITGAVSPAWNSEGLAMSPAANIMEIIQGRVAGLDIVKTSSQVGNTPTVRLRGSRTIYGNNEPLYIVDGIPCSYERINPFDVESIDVLKDASSTAIYGSSGANGVVIITTKHGDQGRPQVSFDAYYGLSGKVHYKHSRTGEDYLTYRHCSYCNQTGQCGVDPMEALGSSTQVEAYNAGKWIDWADEVTSNTATIQRYNVAISSGTATTRMRGSADYCKEEGLLANDRAENYNIHLRFDQQLNPKLKMGMVANTHYKYADQGCGTTFLHALTAIPLGEVYNEQGQLNREYLPGEYSPLSDYLPNQYVDNTRAFYVMATAYAEYKFLPGFVYTLRGSGNFQQGRQGQFWGAQCDSERPTYAGTPHASVTTEQQTNYYFENILTYARDFNDVHSFSATVFTSWQKKQYEMNMAASSGQAVDRWSFWRLASGSSQFVKSDYKQTQMMSYASRFNYSFRDKYLLSFTTRMDGASQLAKGHKWDTFHSAAVAWRLSDEPFMESARPWLHHLKLRCGYGEAGNSGGIDAYSAQTQSYVYSAYGVTLNGRPASFAQYTGTYGSSDLTWEHSGTWNIGVDFGLGDDRLVGWLETYCTCSKGLLFKRNAPVTSGATGWGSPLTIWTNCAHSHSQGLELTLVTRNVEQGSFAWNSTLTAAWNSERIKDLPTGDVAAEGLFEGHPIHSIYDYKYLGVWGSDASADDLETYGVQPGYLKIATNPQGDDEGRHRYSTSDRQILGHSNPDVIVGLNNDFTYRNFDFTLFMMARLGQTVQSSMLSYYPYLKGMDYWSKKNEQARYPRPGSESAQSNVLSALTVCNGSFMKVENITLGYRLPQDLNQRLHLKSCRLYITAYNPIVWAFDKQLRGLDPETGGSATFPTYSQYAMGVSVTF